MEPNVLSVAVHGAGPVALHLCFIGCELGLFLWSAGPVVLVEEAGDGLSAFDPDCGQGDDVRVVLGRELVSALVGPVAIEVAWERYALTGLQVVDLRADRSA
ncbi:hypothetical protein [Streptomyces sp. MK37H]|uniref:hypothetical protein n=1 Tax=Streptomyces sp. MK37H TaxID=2699117 RepID=UPI001B394AC6|nr:hypothetical protein [Streptomyces sp. MK37H]MBP8531925.1 hypothetical protein [Streptomyces sp. MK37H]